MPKPDKVLRTRPLKELGVAVSKLKRVVLFHPKPVVEELHPKFCVCGKGERKIGKKTKKMTQCDRCWEWFHNDCAGIGDDVDASQQQWSCEWCRSIADDRGYQRWKSGRKKPKLRHVRDLPKVKGAKQGENPPPRHTAPPTWEGKVAEIKELSRRATIKKRKLKEAVQVLVDEGGHHVMDEEGMAGLEVRGVDDGLVDEMVGAGLVDPDQMSDEG